MGRKQSKLNDRGENDSRFSIIALIVFAILVGVLVVTAVFLY